MNAEELRGNAALTEWTVQDLNKDPALPYATDSFDCVLCQLSIDYLTRPLQVCREIARVLRPGGTVHVLFSNRLFLSKAVALWTGADDVDHAFTVASYLHFCCEGPPSGAKFEKIRAADLSKRGRDGRIRGDPLYVVTAVKSVASDGADASVGN
jgi:SAM-dependent methyltransferase